MIYSEKQKSTSSHMEVCSAVTFAQFSIIMEITNGPSKWVCTFAECIIWFLFY